MKEIKLEKSIGPNYSDMELKDVLNVKMGLNRVGYYEEPKYGLTPYPDDQLFKSIKNYQEENDLKIDGIMRPDGETIRSLNKTIKNIAGRSPIIRCTVCGGPHGGSQGDICPDCSVKL